MFPRSYLLLFNMKKRKKEMGKPAFFMYYILESHFWRTRNQSMSNIYLPLASCDCFQNLLYCGETATQASNPQNMFHFNLLVLHNKIPPMQFYWGTFAASCCLWFTGWLRLSHKKYKQNTMLVKVCNINYNESSWAILMYRLDLTVQAETNAEFWVQIHPHSFFVIHCLFIQQLDHSLSSVIIV